MPVTRTEAAAAAAIALAVVGVTTVAIGLGVGTSPPSAPAPPLSVGAIAAPVLRADTTGPLMTRSVPTRLDIPAIDVRTPLLDLGRAKDGSVAMPRQGKDYDTAGWYLYSPTPGMLGPAVIAGHVDSAAGGRSVFYRLGALKAGDVVRVSRADGSVAVFEVDAVRRFEKAAFPTTVVYGNTDHAALRLVTCGGPLDPDSGHYRDNVVVTASLVSAE